MLHVGLDLSRRRVGVCLISSEGELVEHFRAPADRDGLYGLTRRLAVYDEPVRGVVESMNGARFVHDELVGYGWEVLVADAQRVKGLAPLACRTDKVDARVLAELSFRDLVTPSHPTLAIPPIRLRGLLSRQPASLPLCRRRGSRITTAASAGHAPQAEVLAYAAFRVLLRRSRLRLIAGVGGRGSLGSGKATASDPSCGRGRRGSLGPDGGSGRRGLGERDSGGGSAGPVVADGGAGASSTTARRPRVTDHRPAMNATSPTTTTTTRTRSVGTMPHYTATGAGLRGFWFVAVGATTSAFLLRLPADLEQEAERWSGSADDVVGGS